MSGHSHWSKVKWKKGVADTKKSKVFSKMVRNISIAVREGGEDPSANSKLRLAIEMAKKINLPTENIERAIKRGTGEIETAKLESVLFEAYGPGKIAILIEGITDNKNRTLSEIKQILTQNGGKLANAGSVKWLFRRKGVITISPQSRIPNFKTKEDLELSAIEAGAEDFYWHNDLFDFYVKPEELEKVKKNLEKKGIQIESVSLDWVAKEMIKLDEKNKAVCQRLFEDLDENEAVQEIYSNLKT